MPTVSIVIPAYGGANLIGQTIDSVLAQTYGDFELIIVDDASPDETGTVVQSYSDPRIRYIRHATNQGANQAWLTGLRAAQGELIACLDQDDLFHPEKLAEHVKLHQERPSVGISYNARFEIVSPSARIYGIWPAPVSVTLADLVLGFPFAPSDMILRRDWALMDGLWMDNDVALGNETIVNGAEYVYCGRLWYAGCEFAGIPRALNYRRYHSGRTFRNLAERCASELRCQRLVLAHPQCPAEVQALQPQVLLNTYLSFANLAFAQGEFELGYTWLCDAATCDPAILRGDPAPIVHAITTRITPDEHHDLEAILQQVFAQLPPALAYLQPQRNWAIGRSHLLQGTRALMWEQTAKGSFHLERAKAYQAEIDESFANELAYSLLIYERELGAAAAETVLRRWQAALAPLGHQRLVRQMVGNYLANRAFQRFRAGDYAAVPGAVLQAMRADTRYLRNRGLFSIMARSLYTRPTQRAIPA
jgi:hypothetical protein